MSTRRITMNNLKKMTIANFNITFGQEEEPLLDYFDTIFMPAITNGITRKLGDAEYLLSHITVNYIYDNYVLSGVIVKKTELEILSKYDELSDELLKTNELYDTAPYSIFTIFLKNHRMAYVSNQKGSPSLKSFSATINYILRTFIGEENKKRKSRNLELLPYAMVNIVGIPMREDVHSIITNVAKINKLTLKFYPLNGDLDYGEIFDGLTTDIRKALGSKTGSTTFNSPTSTDGIVELLDKAQGTVEPTFYVTYPDKKKGKISNYELSESLTIDMPSDGIEHEINTVIKNSVSMGSIQRVSDENIHIFKKNMHKILEYIKKG